MSIFQKSVVNKYLSNQDQEEFSKAYKKFQKFYGDSERIENIKLLKEENYQEGFLREIFVQVLGYKINPDKNYNLTTEYKNETDSKKADGAILKNSNAIGVIELKSTKTVNLESIINQAFNYKNHQPKCKYVITSNFEKLNFYIDNATEWEEFNLFSLTEKDFALFYLLLNHRNLLNDVPFQIKKESRLHEENISDKLYKDYSQFKHKIYNNLVKNNPQFDKLVLFKKSQKLLDRVLFILFAEDSGLVPPNAISRIVDQWKTFKEFDEPVSLYSRFIKLFNHLDEGHKYPTYSLPAYNGGLFQNDEILDNVHIDDEILLDDMLHLSSYDFSTEVDVNILGHIFEHSLTEIEELTAELEGTLVEREKSKRKKDGIFYTPKYITKYIVDNTIGALCSEKKKELNLNEIDEQILENSKTKSGSLTVKAEKIFNNLDKYREYILTLKILDPACGSGAFLNQALEFLINEHKWIDEHKASLLQEAFAISEYEKDIVENNLFGVDINEEAVEIAKLSLWLRTARKGRKLSTLSDNIKCGNSLIDDLEIAGDKAFNWNEEFMEIMQNGGFDVVIGNPPYVNANELKKALSEEAYKWLKKNYQTAKGTVDLYIYFLEKSILLLKQNGFLSFITPNRYLSASYGKAIRSYIINNAIIISIIDYSDTNVFKDVSTYPIISVFRKSIKEKYLIKIGMCESENYYSKINETNLISSEKLNLLTDNIWGFLLNTKIEIVEKLLRDKECVPINESAKINATSTAKEADSYHDIINLDSGFKLVNTGTIDRYNTTWQNEILIDKGEKYIQPYLTNKSEKISENRIKLYSRPKIILAKIALRTEAFFDREGEYSSINTNCFHSFNKDYNPNYILAWINSKLFQFIFECYFDGLRMSGGYLLYSSPNLSSVFIKKINLKIQDIFSKEVLLIEKLIFRKNEKIYKFILRLKTNFPNLKLSKILKDFYLKSFGDIINELKKQKIKLTLKQQDEWEDYFDEYKTQINQLQEQITKTDNEIDVMVYKLYNLTYEEVKIVDPNFWMSEEEYKNYNLIRN